LVLLTRSMMSGQPRMMNWLWFIAAWSAGVAAVYLATVLHTHNSPHLLAIAGQWLPTALLYPLADRLIGAFEDADPRFR
jgi:hypothetical protein